MDKEEAAGAVYPVPDDEAPIARSVRRRPLHSRPTLK
jgi:hypothetical protein